MKAYLDILKHVLQNGERKENRTGIDTLVVPPQMLTCDLRDGFPLLTTKKMAKKSMLVELEGFIGGITDKRWYQERGCNIWNEWSNPTNNLDNDLGPIYGHQWRRFGHTLPSMCKQNPLLRPEDQLATIINSLKTNPNDRRMVCMAWNPTQNAEMALPPCHLGFVLQHINGVLHLAQIQRSCDMFLGVPFNLASYAMLLTLLAKEAGMAAGTLNIQLVDCHVYVNHLDQCHEQLSRTERPLPEALIGDWSSIWDWTHKDVIFSGYDPHPPIKGKVAV